MELFFLGTGAGLPSKERNVSAIALKMLQEQQSIWLFDCGESTQHQILKTTIKPRKIEKIFITHLHGDHIYGLPGLLSSRSFQSGDTLLTLYGPKGIKEYIETSLRVSGTNLTYPLVIKEVQTGLIFENEDFQVYCRELQHGIPSYGYRMVEREQPGELQPEKLKQDGIPPGPLYQKIKENETTELDNGQIIHRADYTGPLKEGRIVTILGDTRSHNSLTDFVAGSDVLVHEATFSEDEEELAFRYFHSTTTQAATLAKESNVKQLVLTHISSRYQKDQEAILLQEAREIFPASDIASDFFQKEISRRD